MDKQSQMRPSPKLLIPTFLNRYCFVEYHLAAATSRFSARKPSILHVGCGEGDYDPMLSHYCERLISCDIHEGDLSMAMDKNKDLHNVSYMIENAVSLSFEDSQFDILVSVDVIEHVECPIMYLREVSRVLRPGGIAIITFPNLLFPITYDLLNYALELLSTGHLPIGAYAFGHSWLPLRHAIRVAVMQAGGRELCCQSLSMSLIGFLEMYWVGFLQRILKSNSSNSVQPSHEKSNQNCGRKVTPIQKHNLFLGLLHRSALALCRIDKIVTFGARDGINTGLVYQKGS